MFLIQIECLSFAYLMSKSFLSVESRDSSYLFLDEKVTYILKLQLGINNMLDLLLYIHTVAVVIFTIFQLDVDWCCINKIVHLFIVTVWSWILVFVMAILCRDAAKTLTTSWVVWDWDANCFTVWLDDAIWTSREFGIMKQAFFVIVRIEIPWAWNSYSYNIPL